MSETKTKERWYVTTDFFKDGGKSIKTRGGVVLGPWPDREQALACRLGYEQGAGMDGRFYVDQLID